MIYISLMLFLVGFFVFFYQAINMKFILEKLKLNEPEFYSKYFFIHQIKTITTGY